MVLPPRRVGFGKETSPPLARRRAGLSARYLPTHRLPLYARNRHVQDDRKHGKYQRRTLNHNFHGEVTGTLSHMSQPNALTQAPAGSLPREREPRWPAVLAILATGGLYFVIPASLRFGQQWLLLAVVSVLLIPTIVTHRIGKDRLNHILGHMVLAIITASMVGSLSLLIHRLPSHADSPVQLLRGAACLWMANILVFASWYWRLDAGGPNERDRRASHDDGAFLFPQMITPWDSDKYWRPGFVDYLFLAFNTSTAFSPTDVPVLSRWAKVMMMVQASISLVTVALLAARAVNIL